MMDITTARDTFSHLLDDNIIAFAQPKPPIHLLRNDPNDRSADALAMNAINIQYLNFSFGNATVLASQQVVIDIINDDDNIAALWVSAVATLLSSAFFTPAMSYVDPTLPVATGYNLVWDSKRVTFKKVSNDNYAHYSCTLNLQFRGI